RVATTTLQVIQDVDLLISAVSSPDSQAYTGNPISVTHTIHNAGGSSTNSTSYVGIYLSTDATITTTDTRIGSRYVYSLAGGGSSSRTASFNIPANLAAGTYYLGAIADYANQQTESNEDNNGLTATTPLNID
ncbi:MAG TPA: peptidase, partial [Gammaproteobacteria bacterium]|nr:peptidase [Gammaproteobacteria bacterium]